MLHAGLSAAPLANGNCALSERDERLPGLASLESVRDSFAGSKAGLAKIGRYPRRSSTARMIRITRPIPLG
jgi:hypothetical protein